MDWFLYDNGLHHERVQVNNEKARTVCEVCPKLTIQTLRRHIEFVSFLLATLSL